MDQKNLSYKYIGISVKHKPVLVGHLSKPDSSSNLWLMPASSSQTIKASTKY